MILTNLAKAVREQNYFAVVLEFVIVIAGVVIGFQITAWNDTLNERAREIRYLERLASDLDVALRRTEGARDFRADVRELGLEALSYAEQRNEPSDPFRVVYTFFQSSQAGGINLPSAAYTELLSTGDLSIISNDIVRQQLTNFYGQGGFENILDEFPPYRETVRGLIPILYQTYIWETCFNTVPGQAQYVEDCPAPEGSEPDTLAEQLLADETLHRELRYWVSAQSASLIIYDSQVEMLQHLQVSIQNELADRS